MRQDPSSVGAACEKKAASSHSLPVRPVIPAADDASLGISTGGRAGTGEKVRDAEAKGEKGSLLLRVMFRLGADRRGRTHHKVTERRGDGGEMAGKWRG